MASLSLLGTRCPGLLLCTQVLQKLLEMGSKMLQGQQVGEDRDLGSSTLPPANSCWPFAHTRALHVGLRPAKTACRPACTCPARALHADSSHTLHKHPRFARSSCLMRVLTPCTGSHILHVHSYPSSHLAHLSPAVLHMPCLRTALLPDTLLEAEHINIYLCVEVKAALYIARKMGSFCGRALSVPASS